MEERFRVSIPGDSVILRKPAFQGPFVFLGVRLMPAGRIRRRTVDYFPHFIHHKRTMAVIEDRYGSIGYAAWFKLLELLGDTDGHSYDAGNSINMAFLGAKIRMESDIRDGFMALLADLEAIDRELWGANKVIWCQHFVENLTEVYRKRKEELPSRPNIRDGNTTTPEISATEIRQRKGKERKGEERKEEKDFSSDSDEFRLSALLYDLILEQNPNYKKPNIQSWAKHVSLMIRIDKREPSHIDQVINWCQKDSFWHKNILSTDKLRKQFDRLVIDMNGKRPRTEGMEEWFNGKEREEKTCG